MFRNPVTDLIVVVVVALIIFGPKRLPMLGRALGHGMREFKDGITGASKPDEAEHPALTSAEPASPPSPAPTAPEPAATSAPVTPPAAAEPESAPAERRS